MSLPIDPNLFKEGGGEGGADARPFASPFTTPPRPTGQGFKDPRGITTAMVALLAIDMLLNALLTIGGAAGLIAPDLVYEDTALGAATTALAPLVALSALTKFVVMMFWFYRANKNARSVSAGLETTPGWAVGWFFIPLLSLWRPYQTISEIWRSAVEPLSWRSQPDAPIVRWWWGLYLASAFGPLISRLAEGEAVGPIYLASLALGIAESAVLVVVVRYVARRQWENKDESVFD